MAGSTLIQDFRILTAWCKRLLGVTLAQAILLVLFSVAIMVMNLYVTAPPGENLGDIQNKDIAYGLLVILSCFFLVYFACDAVLNENKFEMVMFGLVSVLLVIRIIFMYVAAQLALARKYTAGSTNSVDVAYVYLTLAVMIVMLALEVFMVLFFVRSWRDFGWKLYRTVGANKELIQYFRTYQIWLSMLKLDLQFGLSLILLAGFFLFNPTQSVALWINVGVMVLSVFWAILGWQAIIRENTVLVVFFFLFMVAEPAYIIYKVTQFYAPQLFPNDQISCVYVPCILFTLSGAFAIVLRTLLLIFTIRCIQNFKKGMKRVFGTEEVRRASAQMAVTMPSSPASPPGRV